MNRECPLVLMSYWTFINLADIGIGRRSSLFNFDASTKTYLSCLKHYCKTVSWTVMYIILKIIMMGGQFSNAFCGIIWSQKWNYVNLELVSEIEESGTSPLSVSMYYMHGSFLTAKCSCIIERDWGMITGFLHGEHTLYPIFQDTWAW